MTAYIAEAMARATYKMLEDGSYFGEVAGLQGVWANEKTLEACRAVLQEVLEDWLVLKLRSNEDTSSLDEVTISQFGV